MNALGYVNRGDFVMEIIKTLFDGVVFCGALATIFALFVVIEAFIR